MKLLVDRLTATPTRYAFEVDGEWWAARAGASGELDHEVVESFHFELKFGEGTFFLNMRIYYVLEL